MQDDLVWRLQVMAVLVIEKKVVVVEDYLPEDLVWRLQVLAVMVIEKQVIVV